MLHRRDRADFAVLGLLVLAWGLVAAPLLHTVEHGHGHGHHHGAPAKSSSHGQASVEHLLAALHEAPVAAPPVFIAVAVCGPASLEPADAWSPARRSPAQPQGP